MISPQAVARKSSEASAGSAEDQLGYWRSLEARLHEINAQHKSPEMQLTEEVLRRGKRFIAIEQFNGTGYAQAVEKTNLLMVLMRDFPLDAVLNAGNPGELSDALGNLIAHCKVGVGDDADGSSAAV